MLSPLWYGQFVRFTREELDLHNFNSTYLRSGLLSIFVFLFEEEDLKTSVSGAY